MFLANVCVALHILSSVKCFCLLDLLIEDVPSSCLTPIASSVDPEIGQFVRLTLVSNRCVPKDLVTRILEKEDELYKVTYMSEKCKVNVLLARE